MGNKSTSFSQLDSLSSAPLPSFSLFPFLQQFQENSHAPSCSEQAKSSWFNLHRLLSKGKITASDSLPSIFLILHKPKYPGKIQELLSLFFFPLLPLKHLEIILLWSPVLARWGKRMPFKLVHPRLGGLPSCWINTSFTDKLNKSPDQLVCLF